MHWSEGMFGYFPSYLLGHLISAQLTKTLEEINYPIPSLSIDSEKFDGMRYWRGPTWAILNSLVGLGLAEMGYLAEAKILSVQFSGLASNQFP